MVDGVGGVICKKEPGYDEWLRSRLEQTIQKLDCGEMKTHSLDEVKNYLNRERAKRRIASSNLSKNR